MNMKRTKIEPIKCSCCGAPLEEDTCSFCGVRYKGVPKKSVSHESFRTIIARMSNCKTYTSDDFRQSFVPKI